MPTRPLLLFLITDLHLGGSPRMLADLVAGLRRIDDADLLVVSIDKLPMPPADDSVPARMRAAGVEVASLSASSSKDLRVLPRLVRLLKERRPAVVCSLLIHANLLATLAKPFAPACRYVQSLHTMQPNPRWHWRAQGMISRFADGFVAPTQAIVDRARLFGPLPAVTAAIPNGIDVAKFRDARENGDAASYKLAASPFSPLIGYVGRFDPVKNLPALIMAYDAYLKELQKVNAIVPHLVLVGYGPQEGALRQQVQQMGLRDLVHFPGKTDHPEMWLKSFSCIALASEVEGYPLSVAEALAAGTPVLALDTPAIRAIVGNDYPLWKNADVSTLADGLQQVMLFGKKWINDWRRSHEITDIVKMSEMYHQFYKNFCSSLR